MISVSDELKKKMKSEIKGKGFNLYFVDQEQVGNQIHLVIYINKDNYDNSISLDDCVEVTHVINSFIDDYIDEEYVLEISSTGINRRLYVGEHFKDVIGQKIKVQLNNRVEGFLDKKIESILEDVNDIGIIINNIEVKFGSIKKAFYLGGEND